MRLGLAAALVLVAPGAFAQAVPKIVSPRDGAVVTSPVTVKLAPPQGETMGTGNMADMPGMSHGAHYHLIIDAPLPAPGAHVPADKHHVHLMHGETTKVLDLAPGPHTLQIVLGSAGHAIAKDAPHSAQVRFTVK